MVVPDQAAREPSYFSFLMDHKVKRIGKRYFRHGYNVHGQQVSWEGPVDLQEAMYRAGRFEREQKYDMVALNNPHTVIIHFLMIMCYSLDDLIIERAYRNSNL